MMFAKKIGLIAGAGSLPYEVIKGAQAQGFPIYVVALLGITRAEDFDVEGYDFKLGEIGKILKTLKKQKCTHVVFAGNIDRPDFSSLKPDLSGVRLLPKVIKAAAKGDDALLRLLVSVFENEGFIILAPQDVCESSVIQEGILGTVQPNDQHRADIEKAYEIAAVMGAHDIGQGAVVANGLVLAVEAQEGTDQMLKRVANLSKNLRGNKTNKIGVLAKRLKPDQEDRVDLPTIGSATIELAYNAGLAGIVVEAGSAFVLDKSKVQTLADQYGLFILGYSGG